MPPLWVDGFSNPEYGAWFHRNKPKDLGPSSDFGWQTCHGCEKINDRWDVGEHLETCPRVCIRNNCEWHNTKS